MKREIITSLAVVLAWWVGGANFAAAQFGDLGQPPLRVRPTVSPYINLRGGGISGAMNYYGIVRPQVDANRSIYEMQSTLNRMSTDSTIQSQLDQQKQASQTGLQTGHSAGFFNYGHYYPNLPPGGSSANLGGGPSFGTGLGIGGNNNAGLGLVIGGGGGDVRTFFSGTFNRGPR